MPTVLLALLTAAACASGGGDRGTAPAPQPPPDQEAGLPEFTLLYFNDLHGHLVPFTLEGPDTAQVGGAARMATLIRRVREENERAGRPTLLLEGGDVFQGTPLSSVFKGEPDFKFLNAIGLDAMVLGNHEFDFGVGVLLERMKEADFPVLAANVRWKQGGRLLAMPYVLRTLSNGVRVAIFGLVTDETPQTTDPANVADLVFEPPLLAASRFMEALEDSSDIILGLTHVGLEADKRLAGTFDDIDVIVGGHDQVLIHQPLKEDEVLITQAQEYGLYLGRIDLEVEGDEVEILADTVYRITREIPDDPQVARMVASYTRRLDRELARTVGSLTAPLEGDRRAIRTRPTNFGLLLATLMKERARAELAVINSGAVRSSIDAGPVTLGEILQALPFANHVFTVQLPGVEIERMLARSLQLSKRTDSGGFLQTAGVTYQAGESGPTRIEIAGKPLEPARVYTVAITDFLFNGGDGYDLFRRAGRNPKETGTLLNQALADHISRSSPLRPPEP